MTLLTEPTRIVLAKGQPVPNDPSFAFNSLLLHGDGTNGSTVITDSSGSPKTVTAVGNAQISTAQSKFGGASILFDSTGDYVSVTSDPAAFEFGLGNFTIELWLKIIAFPVGGVCIYDQRPQSTQNNSPTLYFIGSELRYYAAGSDRITGPTLSTGVWYHVALARQSNSTKLFLNGSQVGATFSDSISYVNTSGRPWIGGFSDNATPATQVTLNGYIDDLRITKGVARYTSNFTPPTAQFPDF